MYLRKCFRNKNGRRYAYWAVVESYRTQAGPRQRTVSILGDLEEQVADQIATLAGVKSREPGLFDPPAQPVVASIDLRSVKVERVRNFGGAWLGLQMAKALDLPMFLEEHLPEGKEWVPWPLSVLALTLGRLVAPSSELHLAEHIYEHSAMADLLGLPQEHVNDDRLYRALDRLLPHKDALHQHIKSKLGELFQINYDLLLYDVTSTYFEGLCKENEDAALGYSRDQRSSNKQVCIALVVSRSGLPLSYEIFPGNKSDVATVQTIVAKIESLYGKSDRVWVMDRGMLSAANIEFLKQEGRRYIIGANRATLKKYQQQLLDQDWKQIRDGLEVKLVPAPTTNAAAEQGEPETYILCRSRDRAQKEKAIHQRFVDRVQSGLEKLVKACKRSKQDPLKISERVGRLMGKNTRGARAFTTKITTKPDGGAELVWSKDETWQDWASLSEGCYLLRSNISNWQPEELWQAYIQLTQAEDAFRIHKSDLELRPIWHRKKQRVEAHILVCFLAYVLWKTLAMYCQQAGLGNEPRKVLKELGEIKLVDVVMTTTTGQTLRRRCVSRPTEHQAILLQHLKLDLPETMPTTECDSFVL